MNYSQVKKEAHTFCNAELLRLKRGRRMFYIDPRSKILDGEYHVHPIAESNAEAFVVCPFCQEMHGHHKRHIKKHNGYVEANCKGRLVLQRRLVDIERGSYFIEGWC